jgi:hypothetical protein
VRDEAIQSKSSIITAVMVLDKSPEEIYNILFQTEDQIKYLEEIKEITSVKKDEVQDNIKFKTKAVLFTFVYRVINNFDKIICISPGQWIKVLIMIWIICSDSGNFIPILVAELL